MSENVNLDELERLARAATLGPWRTLTDSDWTDAGMTPGSTRVYGVGSDYVIGSGLICGPLTHWGEAEAFPQNAPYIAAVSPSVVLSLLKRLRDAEQRHDDIAALATAALDVLGARP